MALTGACVHKPVLIYIKEIAQDFEDDSWGEEGATGVWFALGM